MQLLEKALAIALGATLASFLGCADPEAVDDDGWIADTGGAADGAGPQALVRCRVESEGEGFYRNHTLRCEPGDDLPTAPPIVQVRSVTGTKVYADMNLADADPLVRFFDSDLPVNVTATAYLEGVLGIDSAQVVTDAAVLRAGADLTTPRAIALPFDVWTVTVENRTNLGQLAFDRYTITAQGGRFNARGVDAGTRLEVAASVTLRAGERRTLFVAVTRGQTQLGGLASDLGAGGQGTRFTVTGSGAYVLEPDGLRLDDGVTDPSADGPELARCEPADDGGDGSLDLRCRVTARAGVTLAAATVTVGGAQHQIPTDGTDALIASPGAGPVDATLSVTVASGIAGLPWASPPAVEGAFAVALGGAPAVLTLPCDLLHARFTVDSAVERAFFDSPGSENVRFSRAWGGLYQGDAQVSFEVSAEQTDAWIAVTAGRTEVAGHLSVLSSEGTIVEHDVVVRAGDQLLSAAGLSALTAPASGTELVRCTIVDGHLQCQRSETAPIIRAHWAVFIESYDRTIDGVLSPGLNGLFGVERLVPLRLTLTVTVAGLDAPLTAEARVTGVSDLPESAPLLVAVP